LLIAAGVLGTNPVWAAWTNQPQCYESNTTRAINATPPPPVRRNYVNGGTINIPMITLGLAPNAVVGEYVSDWISDAYSGGSYYFLNCLLKQDFNALPTGDDSYMYVFGRKGNAGVHADPDVGMKDGYRIFTTPELSNTGLGFIVRWRVASPRNSMCYGAWKSPGNSDFDDDPIISQHGLEFWRVAGGFVRFRWGYIYSSVGQEESNRYEIYEDYDCLHNSGRWISEKNSALKWVYIERRIRDINYYPAESFVTQYTAQVEVRYVKIKEFPPSHQLNELTSQISVPVVAIHPRTDALHQAPIVFLHQVKTVIKPHGTCTTPSLTVPFGGVPESALATPGPAAAPYGNREFNLTLSNCPRINVQYFFRSPSGIPVDNVNGVVGLDSTPGNAQGVGIQLRHNGSHAGTNPVRFNQDGDTTVYTRTPAMGQDGSTGMTHTIPMRATVYRTSTAPVVPGKINASVLVYIQYP